MYNRKYILNNAEASPPKTVLFWYVDLPNINSVSSYSVPGLVRISPRLDIFRMSPYSHSNIHNLFTYVHFLYMDRF